MSRKYLLLSFAFNLFFISIIAVMELQTHYMGSVLERRGILTLDNTSLPYNVERKSWESSLKRMNQSFDIVFYGNSITRYGDFEKYFPRKKIVNLGISGDNILGMTRRTGMIRAVTPSKIFVMAGTNDIDKLSLKCFEKRYEIMVDSIKHAAPHSQIYLQSILPVNPEMRKDVAPNKKIYEANLIIKDIAYRRGVNYIDLYTYYLDNNGNLKKEFTTDGLHLKPSAYRIWVNRIKDLIYSDK